MKINIEQLANKLATLKTKEYINLHEALQSDIPINETELFEGFYDEAYCLILSCGK